MTRHRRSLGWWLLAVAVAASAACGSDGDRASTADPPTASTTTMVADVGGLDFARGSEVDLGEGWTVTPCESGPPLFCAKHGGETQATIELLSVPVSSYPAVKAALDKGRTPSEALRDQAAEFHKTFAADRPEGCGAAYEVKPLGPDAMTVAGRPGMFYGFDGIDQGRHVERALQFVTIDGDTIHLILTNAVDDDTCMDDGTLSEFSVAELTRLQPTLSRVIAASTLP